jgi:hypothetical protein
MAGLRGTRAPAVTGGQLREAMASLLPDGDRDLVEKLAAVAEEHAAALLGGRHLSCARWLPQARSTCGLAAGHLNDCISVAAAVNQRMRAKKRAVRLEAGRAVA